MLEGHVATLSASLALCHTHIHSLISTCMQRNILLFCNILCSFPQAERSSTILAILTDDNTAMTTIEQDTENIGLLDLDPLLKPHEAHFRYQMKRYNEQKKLIEKYEGSLEEFALGKDDLEYWFSLLLFSDLCSCKI